MKTTKVLSVILACNITLLLGTTYIVDKKDFLAFSFRSKNTKIYSESFSALLVVNNNSIVSEGCICEKKILFILK